MNANHWPANTPVTMRARPEVIGRTVLCTARDGRRLIRIRVIDLAHRGAEGWANADVWMLGAGPRQARCVDCGQDYRCTPETFGDGFCPSCNTDARTTSTVPETRSIHGSLRGARTPRKPAPAVAVAEPEPFETPFE